VQNTSLILDNVLNILTHRTAFNVITYKSYRLSKNNPQCTLGWDKILLSSDNLTRNANEQA